VLQGERTSFQVELVHRSGQSRFVQMDCVPEHAADGSVAGYICMGSDVSVLKQAELALREDNQALEQQVQARTAELRASKRRLQAIFESSFQHQVLLDLSGRVVDANDASLAAVLADKKDIVGQRFGESLWFATPTASARWLTRPSPRRRRVATRCIPSSWNCPPAGAASMSAAPAAGRRRRGHRRGIGGGGNHRAAAGRACASPVAEDRGGRPAHRRHRA
jgi:PAS domain-containing protein